MTGAVYGHFMLKEGMDKMTPALVFGLLLACRFIVHLQVKARENKKLKERDEAAHRSFRESENTADSKKTN